MRIFLLKAALTNRDWLMITVHVDAVPEQAPPQPEKVSPLPGVAVKVTLVSSAYSAEQESPHEISPEEVVTEPGPTRETVNGNVVALTAPNTAVTVLASLMETEQVLLSPKQAPPQPKKRYPESGVAVKVTISPDV